MLTYTRAMDSALCVPLMIDAAVFCGYLSERGYLSYALDDEQSVGGGYLRIARYEPYEPPSYVRQASTALAATSYHDSGAGVGLPRAAGRLRPPPPERGWSGDPSAFGR